MPILVLFCYQLVLYGTSWEVCPPLRIRYAPLPETLEKSRGSGFLLPFSTIVSTIVEFQAASGSGAYPPPRAAFSLFLYCFCKFSSILADQRFQLVRGLLPHVRVTVAVDI